MQPAKVTPTTTLTTSTLPRNQPQKKSCQNRFGYPKMLSSTGSIATSFTNGKNRIKAIQFPTLQTSTLHLNSNSQRFSLRKPKASIIGLPKPQKPCFVLRKNNKNTKPGNTRLFPKHSASVKSNRSVVEPSSPKVSCMGRVRSKRDRNGRQKKTKNRPESKQVKKKKTRKRSSLFSSFRSIFRSKSNWNASAAHVVAAGNKDIRSRLPPDEDKSIWIEPEIMENEVVSEREPGPVSHGGTKRLAFGRRSKSLI